MIGKLVLGTTKTSAVPIVIKEGSGLYVEKIVDNQGYLKSGGTKVIKIPSSATKIATGALIFSYYNAGNSLQDEIPDFSNITQIQTNGCHSMFYGCTALTGNNIDFSSLTTLSDYSCQYMFYNCTSLTGDVDLSSLTTTSLQSCAYMFNNCTGLSGHVDMSSLTNLTSNYVCYYMFSASNISSIDLSSLTTVTGNYNIDYMFYNCSNLDTVDLSSLTTTPSCSYTFYGCSKLSTIDLGSLSNCPSCNYTFSGCSSLASISLPNLTRTWTSGAGYSINCTYMFQNCTGLVSANLHSINNLYGNYMFQNCTSLENVDFSSFTYMDQNSSLQCAFYGCTSLENNPLNKIECSCDNSNAFYQTFMGCSNLVNGDFTNLIELTNLRGGDTFRETFKNCTSLEKVNFPSLIRANGDNTSYTIFMNCFSGCTSLTDVYFPMLTILRNSTNVFGNTTPVSTFPSTATVHFRKDMQSIIEALNGYATGWGAGSIVFDQIGTITIGGVEYERFGYYNENGYIAWHKKTSNITTQGGTTYYYLPEQISRSSDYRQTRYAWSSNGGSSYIYTTSISPQIGDYICLQYNVAPSTNANDQITSVDNVFIYTSDSAEPVVGDTAYSNTTGTVLGTISAVA